MTDGIVIRNTGSLYIVRVCGADAVSEVPCKVKGNFRIKGLRTTNPVAYADEVRNIAYADVVSAYPLTAEQEAALSAQLASASGKKVNLNVSVDESLLAGMVVTFGDKVYDGTVGARLAGLKDKLHKVQF